MESAEATSLKLLSFNIQLGIRTSRYRQYVTKGWKHLLPHSRQAGNLERIARVVAGYDLVALQEIDGGSLRSGFVNQVEYLASKAGFPYWYAQLNRDLGPLAQHGNGLLAKAPPWGLEDHKLPGAIPGRGAIVVRVRCRGKGILVVLLHLSLGARPPPAVGLCAGVDSRRGPCRRHGRHEQSFVQIAVSVAVGGIALAPCSAAAAHLAGLAASVGAGPCVGYGRALEWTTTRCLIVVCPIIAPLPSRSARIEASCWAMSAALQGNRSSTKAGASSRRSGWTPWTTCWRCVAARKPRRCC